MEPFHTFLFGYELAEECHGVTEIHCGMDGFSGWLQSEKGLIMNLNLGWPGMIGTIESDPVRQIELAIDYFAEYAGIQLLAEDTV